MAGNLDHVPISVIPKMPCLFFRREALFCLPMLPTKTYRGYDAFATCLAAAATLFFAIPSELAAAPRAANQANVRLQKEKAAKKACLSGDMKGGIELLADLYADTNDLTYIYNQARCYQQNNEPELALNRFREYLRKGPELNPKDKDALDRNMEECQKLIAEQRAAKAGEASPPSSGPPEKPRDIPFPPLPPVVDDNPAKEPKPTSGRGLKIAGAVATSLGLCAIGVGITYHWLRNDLIRNVKEQGFLSASEKNKLDTYKKVYLVSYGVGAAIMVTGVTLCLFGINSSDSDASVALVPSLIPGEVTLTLRGIF